MGGLKGGYEILVAQWCYTKQACHFISGRMAQDQARHFFLDRWHRTKPDTYLDRWRRTKPDTFLDRWRRTKPDTSVVNCFKLEQLIYRPTCPLSSHEDDRRS